MKRNTAVTRAKRQVIRQKSFPLIRPRSHTFWVQATIDKESRRTRQAGYALALANLADFPYIRFQRA